MESMKKELACKTAELGRLKSRDHIKMKKFGEQKAELLASFEAEKAVLSKKLSTVQYREKELKVMQMEHIERRIDQMPKVMPPQSFVDESDFYYPSCKED
jgi:hypothetical protein